MLPPKPGDLLLMTSKVYGQLFIKHNGRVVPDSYLLVKEGHVSHVEGNIDLSSGDVLELFTGKFIRESLIAIYDNRNIFSGHITSEKSYGIHAFPGISVEDITLCLIS